jgi:hypothetical protein
MPGQARRDSPAVSNVPHTSDYIVPVPARSVDFFGVQLNAAGVGVDAKVSVGVGSLRGWNSLILLL